MLSNKTTVFPVLIWLVAFLWIATSFDSPAYAQGRQSFSSESLTDSTPTVKIGGEFTLTDQNGAQFKQSFLLGKPTVLFFGFTHCPDVCPTTLHTISQLMEKLGNEVQKLNFVFISLDPERDTPDRMKTYIDQFDHRIVGLTGTTEEILKVTRDFRVYRQKRSEEGKMDPHDYMVDHSSLVYLFDKNFSFTMPLRLGQDIRELEVLIRTFL